MPSIVELLLHPERRRPSPPPPRVDLRPIILMGIALWAIALVASLVLVATGAAAARAVAISVAGIVLGGLGLLWEHRNRAAYQAEQADQEEGVTEGPSED